MYKYPFPHRQRASENHQSLNGFWQYKVINGANISSNRFYQFKQEIKLMDGLLEVPYSLESKKNQIGRVLQPDETLLMSLMFDMELVSLDRLFLYFGAVDQRCRIWLNEKEVGYHEDGYLPFEVEVTSSIQKKNNQLVMAIIDESDQGDVPWGKQKLNHGQIWYTPQSGIWQSCGLISYPQEYIRDFYTQYHPQTQQVELFVDVEDPKAVHVVLYEPTLAGREDEDFLEKSYEPLIETTKKQLTIDQPKLWSPDQPWLYPMDLYYKNDRVRSYVGLRHVGSKMVDGIRKMSLNDDVVFHTGVLDQGYWQEGLYTATNQEFIEDLEMVKAMGFNMVRKHIKLEPFRWYFHCDRLGLFVWQDLVNGGNDYSPLVIQVAGFLNVFLNDANYRLFGRKNRSSRLLSIIHQDEVIKALRFFPSIVMWCIFNEGWGQFDSLAMAKRARQLDPTRYIDHASGWIDHQGFDFKSVHIYFKPVKLRPSNRLLILSEFGGYSHPVDSHHQEKIFGYRRYDDLKAYQQGVIDLYERQIIPQKHLLSGVCYTQLSDVEEEVNGLVTFDREVMKWDVEDFKHINEKLKTP